MSLIIALVALRIFSNSLSGVFQKKLSNYYGAYLINFVCYLMVAVFCLIIFHGFLCGDKFVFIYAILMGLSGAIGNAFQIKAFHLGELSILAPINSYKIIFSLIFSLMILKELPSKEAAIGIILIIFGTYIIFNTTKEKFSFKLFQRKDIQYRIIAVLMTALEAVFIKKTILLSDEKFALFMWAILSSLFSFCFIKNIKKSFIQWKESFCSIKKLSLFLFLALSMIIMQYSTNILFKIMNVSYALSLFQLSSIVSVVLGWKIFKEKNVLNKLLGTLIMAAGACLIILNS